MRRSVTVPGRSRALAALATAIAATGALAGALVLGGPVVADTAPPGAATPRTVAGDALPAPQINGVGWEQVIVGRTVYVVGDFSTARPAGAAPGTHTVRRSNILAYDLHTGRLDKGFAPRLNAQAREVTASPDGSRLYVGGDFTQANGARARYVVALDARSGARVRSFSAGADAPVLAIATKGDRVYLGGRFTKVNGKERSRLAAVKAGSGALLRWAPQANGIVDALQVSPDGSKVVAGGRFTTMNGSSNPGYGLAALSRGSGDNLPVPANSVIRNGGTNAGILSLASDGTYLFGSAFNYSGDDAYEGAFALRWSDLSIAFMEDCHGDTYDVAATNNAMYVAGHPHSCEGVGGYPQTDPQTTYRSLAFTKRATQTLRPTLPGTRYGNFGGQPAPSLLVWFPKLDAGTYTGDGQAAWSVAATDRYVVLAGEFPKVNGKPQQGLVRFAVPSTAPNKLGPEDDGADIRPSVQPFIGSARVSWTTNWDRDNQQLTYKVLRDGKVVETRSASSTFWQRPDLTFDDTGASSGEHRYAIRTTDAFGNTVTSPTVTVTVL